MTVGGGEGSGSPPGVRRGSTPGRCRVAGGLAGRCRAVRAAGDRGSVGLFMAVLATAMLMMAGLVIDGGTALAARQRAADVAQQAARAGADALDYSSLRQGAPAGLRADPAAAVDAAQRMLQAAAATGEVSVAGSTVTVTAHVAAATQILSAVGLTDISQSATWSAEALEGVDSAGGAGG